MAACPEVVQQEPISSIISGNNNTTSPHGTSTGIQLDSLTGPEVHIHDIDDYSCTTVHELKVALLNCLDLPEWIMTSHVNLYIKGQILDQNDLALDSVDIKDGSKIRYVLLIP